MIICACSAVSHRQIAAAIEGGARSLAELGDACGAGTGCGSCAHRLCDMIEVALSAPQVAPIAPAQLCRGTKREAA